MIAEQKEKSQVSPSKKVNEQKWQTRVVGYSRNIYFWISIVLFIAAVGMLGVLAILFLL